jgi:hypothetical protein
MTEPAPSAGRMPPSRAGRITVTAAVAVLCAAYVVRHGHANPGFTSDFDQVWTAARALWRGVEPYSVVGPGREFEWKWPLYYPGPALVLAAPLGLLGVIAARAVFAAGSAALLAWALTREGYHRLLLLLSVPFLVNVVLVQWSALVTAMYFLPMLGAFAVAKPNLGVAVGLAARENRGLLAVAVGAAVLLLASAVVLPAWWVPWMENLRTSAHFEAPIQRPFGPLLLLSILRWRRPEARWLLGLAIVPVAPSFYDPLLLAVVFSSAWQCGAFVAMSMAHFAFVSAHLPQPDYADWGRVVGNATVLFFYLPALALLLGRPNEGSVPGVVDGLDRGIRSAWRRVTSRGVSA